MRGLLRAWSSPHKAPILSLAVIAVGALATIVLLSRPVPADYPDDTLLRFADLGAAPADLTEVDCGSAFEAAGRDSDGSSLAALARDEACRTEGSRRLAVAFAAGTSTIGAGLTGLVLGRPRPQRARAPARAADPAR